MQKYLLVSLVTLLVLDVSAMRHDHYVDSFENASDIQRIAGAAYFKLHKSSQDTTCNKGPLWCGELDSSEEKIKLGYAYCTEFGEKIPCGKCYASGITSYPCVTFYDEDGNLMQDQNLFEQPFLSVFQGEMNTPSACMEAAFRQLDAKARYKITGGRFEARGDSKYDLILYNAAGFIVYDIRNVTKTEDTYTKVKALFPEADFSALEFAHIKSVYETLPAPLDACDPKLAPHYIVVGSIVIGALCLAGRNKLIKKFKEKTKQKKTVEQQSVPA